MKKTGKRLLTAAGVIALLGLALLLAGFALGGREAIQAEAGLNSGRVHLGEHTIQIGGENGIRIDEGGIHIGSGLPSGGSHHAGDTSPAYSCGLEGVTDLEVDLSLGDITVREGDRPYLELSYPDESCALRYSFSDGKLKVWSEAADHGHMTDAMSGCRVNITLPANTTLREVELSTDLGDITWSVSALCREADLSTDLGDVTCSSLLADDLSCETDMGNVALALPGGREKFCWKLETDMGNILVDGKTESSGMGSVKHEGGSGEKLLEASSHMGNVSVDFT